MIVKNKNQAPGPRRPRGATPPPPSRSRARLVEWCVTFAAFASIVLLLYHPAWHGGILWDDDGHLTRAELRSWIGLWRIWTEPGATQQYYPLAHSAFWMLARLAGDNTLVYHLTNIVLHACSATLVVVLLRRLDVPGAWLAGLIFAIHPVQVESVAWMTELKNVLSGVLYFLAALAYLDYDESRWRSRYALALGLFVLALAAKTVTATLPAGLVVALWWKRGRLDVRHDVAPLVPWLGLGLAAAVVTSWVERHFIGAQGTEFTLPWIARTLVAGRAVWFYLGKIVWPSPLIFSYPKWTVTTSDLIGWVALVAVVVTTAAAWAIRRRTRAPLAAWLYFGVTLSPALGFVEVYPFRYSHVADHFQYLACLGPIVLVAAGLTRFADRWAGSATARTVAHTAVAALVGLPLAMLTWRQSQQYVSSEVLYRTTLAANPSSWMALHNLGALELTDGSHRLAEAESLIRASLVLNPENADAQATLSTVLIETGRQAAAVEPARAAVRLAPASATSHGSLGAALESTGAAVDAAREYRAAIALAPDYELAHRNLGNLLQREGQLDDAAVELTMAIRLNPNDAAAHANLATTRLKQGRGDEAIAEYRESIRLDPSTFDARFNLGGALRRTGRAAEAAIVLADAVRLAPGSTGAHAALASVLQDLNRSAEAAVEFSAAIRTSPDGGAPSLYNDLGVALASSGRLADAVAAFREAVRRQPDFAEARTNLVRAEAALRGR